MRARCELDEVFVVVASKVVLLCGRGPACANATVPLLNTAVGRGVGILKIEIT
jgi:hypothetical protein